MDNTNVDCTVSRSCDDPLKSTDMTKDVKIISVFSKDNVISSTTNKVKRSERLSRKRTIQKKLAVEGSNLYNICNIAKSIASKISNVEHSLGTHKDNEVNISLKSLLKTHKNKTPSKSITSIKNKAVAYNENKDDMSNELKESDNFVFTRKRGRPSLKKLELQKTDPVNICNDNDKIDKQKMKGLIVEKLHNSHELELPKSLDDNSTTIESYCKPLKIKKKGNSGDKLSDTIKTAKTELSISKVTSPSETAVKVPIIHKEMSIDVLSENNQLPHLGTLEPDISLLSKRFNISLETFKKSIVEASLSVFNEKFSASVTPSMMTVSPIVVDDFKAESEKNENNEIENICKYKIEPIRESLAYEKQNLKDLMDELSKTMPAWSLNIVHNPPRYVISHVSIDIFGTPSLNKAIVLDKYFRGSIYINKSLNYKYCKYYTTANEIIKLIKDLNDISI